MIERAKQISIVLACCSVALLAGFIGWIVNGERRNIDQILSNAAITMAQTRAAATNAVPVLDEFRLYVKHQEDVFDSPPYRRSIAEGIVGVRNFGAVSETLKGIAKDIRRETLPAINKTIPIVNETIADLGRTARQSSKTIGAIEGAAVPVLRDTAAVTGTLATIADRIYSADLVGDLHRTDGKLGDVLDQIKKSNSLFNQSAPTFFANVNNLTGEAAGTLRQVRLIGERINEKKTVKRRVLDYLVDASIRALPVLAAARK